MENLNSELLLILFVPCCFSATYLRYHLAYWSSVARQPEGLSGSITFLKQVNIGRLNVYVTTIELN